MAALYAVTAAPSTTTELGIRLLPGRAGASLRVWAPNASAINVRLRPSDAMPIQTLPLSREAADQAYWSAEIGGVAVGHLYQVEVTNRGGDNYDPGGLPFLRVDPCARQVTGTGPMLPALVVDPTTFVFNSPFRTPSFENFIIYQGHVGSLAGRNDGIPVRYDNNGGTATFAQIGLKLDYIRSMNFNAVQLLPTGEYRGSEGEAYNPTNYYAPEELYGSPDDLRRLVDACHSRGLAVFLDVVYNHMDFMDNLWQFDGNTDHRIDESDPRTGGGIYFSPVDTWFGRRPDHDSPDVQRFFIENASMWFNEYHVDGLRFDSAVNFSANGLRTIVQTLIRAYPEKFIYAEDNDPNYVFNDIGFRACWDMGSADDFLRVIGGTGIYGLQELIVRGGYPTAYSAIKYLLGSHDQIFNKWLYDDPSRQWRWDKPGGGGLRENRYFVERIGGPVTGRNNWYARAQARIGWALNVAMPCTPMLFMGNECYHYGYWNPENDPYGDHRFDWSIAGDPTSWEMRGMVRDVNSIRWNHPALRSDTPPMFPHFDTHNRVLAFHRIDGSGDRVLIIVNLSDNQWSDAVYGVNVGNSGERWTEMFNSQAPQYGGWSGSGNYMDELRVDNNGQFRIRLPQWSVLMFQET